MEYQKLIDEVKNLDFVESADMADAAIKAVFGILARNLPEAHAQLLTAKLPAPLTLETLRSHQKRPEWVSFDEHVTVLAGQFKQSNDQARTLISTVLRIAKDAVDRKTIDELREYLPPEWGEVVQKSLA